MKRICVLLLILSLLLCGCGRQDVSVQQSTQPVQTTAPAPAETQAPTTEPTTEPTTVPTEPPVCRNPFNGELLDGPFTDRVYANIVSNLQENLPHVGVAQADMVIEAYASMNNVVRCIAIFTDIGSVEAIGSTRSTRPVFNDLAQHYSLILSHGGGSETAMADASSRGIEHINIDSWKVAEAGASYRDTVYKRPYENTLFGIGSGIQSYAETQGFPMYLEKDYGFAFTEDGTPDDGADADKITIHMIYRNANKETILLYDHSRDKYVWNQYGKAMTDQITGQEEAFTNVLILYADVTHQGIYHQVDFLAGGTGYYANGGYLIPIVWGCDGETEPLHFMTTDAQPLELGVGNTYITILHTDSTVDYEDVVPVETTVPETVPETLPETTAATQEDDPTGETEDCL